MKRPIKVILGIKEKIFDIWSNTNELLRKVDVCIDKLSNKESEMKDYMIRNQTLYDDLNNILKDEIVVGGSRYNWITQILAQLKEEIVNAENSQGNQLTDRQIIKNIISSKWKVIDRLISQQTDKELCCPVCSEKINTNTCERKESNCIFGGGVLIRYKCPKCGVIFGPQKMFELTNDEFSEDYKIHYSVYPEGDSTEEEKAVFYKLNPEKGKTYLNYGAGAWARTIKELRGEGYDVWGFDPYAPIQSEYIIKDAEKLERMKFDGIFSHDLLEHLKNPIAEFERWKKILKRDGIMLHSTACYYYVYEYTRFHLLFYTGNSVKVLSEKAGFEISSYNEDLERMVVDYTFTLK